MCVCVCASVYMCHGTCMTVREQPWVSVLIVHLVWYWVYFAAVHARLPVPRVSGIFPFLPPETTQMLGLQVWTTIPSFMWVLGGRGLNTGHHTVVFSSWATNDLWIQDHFQVTFNDLSVFLNGAVVVPISAARLLDGAEQASTFGDLWFMQHKDTSSIVHAGSNRHWRNVVRKKNVRAGIHNRQIYWTLQAIVTFDDSIYS